jgi:CRISPR/Cas system CMR-associated protein Cmr5 small subunit
MPARRGGSTSPPRILDCGLSGGCIGWGSKAEKQHHHRQCNMQPNISGVVGNHAKDWLITVVESERRHHSIDYSEDLEKGARRARTGHSAKEKDGSRCEMDNVMREIDVKDAKQHLIIRRGRDKPENAYDQKNYTEKDCGWFDHFDLLLV